MRLLLTTLHRVIAMAVAALLAATLGLATTGAAPAGAAPHDASTASAPRLAERVIKNCRTSDVPCRYRVVKFAYGSRRYYMIKHELTLRPARSRALPDCYGSNDRSYVMRIFEDDSSAVHEYGCIVARPVSYRGWSWDWITSPTFWSTTWKVATCVAAITIALVPMLKAARLIRELGGIRETAELIVGAGTWDDLKQSVPKLAEEIVGIGAVTDACF